MHTFPLSFPPSFNALFFRFWLYFYALLDSSPSARRHLNWTEQSSTFPSSFEGCQPCIPKNHPSVFETLVPPSCNAPSILLWIRCIFQKIQECSKEGTLISAFVSRSFVHVLSALCARLFGLPVWRRCKSPSYNGNTDSRW